MKSSVVWLTARPAAGKSTLVENCKIFWERFGGSVKIIDGDFLREVIAPELGFSVEDRAKRMKLAAQIALFMAKTCVESRRHQCVFVSMISPLDSEREAAREYIENAGVPFHLVYLKASYETCAQRDTKGLYAKAAAGKLSNFTGLDSPFEEPSSPDLVINTDNIDPGKVFSKFNRYALDKELFLD